MAIPKELLEILVCPQCKGKVRLRRESQVIVCEHCKLAYPVRDGIPVMLIDEAVEI
jgi:uncharacterized protein YbaR (Trm112 family)